MKRLLIPILMMMSLTCLSAHEKGYEFRGEIYGFAGLTDYLTTSGGISITNGYRITERLFVGAGAGFEISKSIYKYVDVGDSYSYAPQRMIPVFASIKYNMGRKAASPFVLLDAGWTFNVGKDEEKKAMYGLLFNPRVGVDVGMVKGYGLFAAVGPRFQNIHYRHLTAGKGDWIVDHRSEFLTMVCLHIGIRF